MYVKNYSFIDDCSERSTELQPGIYQFDLWGAKGGGTHGGKGGFSSGILFLRAKTTFFINVGGVGQSPNGATGGLGGCNGGGNGGDGKIYLGNMKCGGYGGGGATDIRIMSNELSDRIIVAGGGGGQTMTDSDIKSNKLTEIAGNGGGISGSDGYMEQIANSKSEGATQSTGNINGIGSNGRDGTDNAGVGAEGGGGAGGGYYGGLTFQNKGESTNMPGGGGSGYVSGHYSVLEHHSLVRFRSASTQNIDQNNKIESPDKDGNGFISITFLSPLYQTCRPKHHIHYIIVIYIITLIS